MHVISKGLTAAERDLYVGCEVAMTGEWDLLGQAEVLFVDGPLTGECRYFKPASLDPSPLRTDHNGDETVDND